MFCQRVARQRHGIADSNDQQGKHFRNYPHLQGSDARGQRTTMETKRQKIRIGKKKTKDKILCCITIQDATSLNVEKTLVATSQDASHIAWPCCTQAAFLWVMTLREDPSKLHRQIDKLIDRQIVNDRWIGR
jgi:hypothetical protein